MDSIGTTKQNNILYVSTNYDIVEKEETRVLIKILNDCKKLYEAYEIMSFPLQEDMCEDIMIKMINSQIDKKLIRLYRWYHRHYGIVFDNGDWGEDNLEFSEQYRREKATENNISLICETVKCWEN